MQFLVYDLGQQKRKTIVEVRLTASTNVRLMDNLNYDLYKNNQQYKFFGGYVKTSPFRLEIPKDGRWVLTIDVVQDPKFKYSVNVIPEKLPDAW